MSQHYHHSLKIPSIKGESAAGFRGVSLWSRARRTRRTTPYAPFKGGLGSILVPRWYRPWRAFLKFITGMALSTFFFPISGSGQAREQQRLTKDLEKIARVATILVDGDVCQQIMTDRALKKIFTVDPRDPWAGSDNFDVNAAPYIQTKKILMRLARLASYPVDCNLWMPFKDELGKIQVLIRNQYEMSQFWSFGQLYTDTFPEMKEVLATGKPRTVQKSGDIVSVLSPVYNSLGDIVGLVEVVSRA